VFTADVDGDGKLDLLVGDTARLVHAAKGTDEAKARTLYPDDERSYRGVASVAMQRGDIETAVTVLREGLVAQPGQPGLLRMLGDILLHIVFYARIAKEQNAFTLDEMINALCEKLINRHPHIYGDVQVADEEDVKRNWEQLKLREGKKSILSGVPRTLPATVKAMRLQEKARQVGFEWETREQVWQKVKEEEQELLEAVASGNTEKISGEFGDLIFSLINYARFLGIDAEDALERTNKKFIKRFTGIESAAAAEGRSMHEMSLEEMDALWEKIKSSEKS
jgi:XTP/dITP diphosphohydrolase